MFDVLEKKEFNRSPFFYVGDKYKLVPQLREFFPKNIDRFIEPFCGGGSVFLNTDANAYLLNDINEYMVRLHEMLISYSCDVDSFWDYLKSYIRKYELTATFMGRDLPADFRKQFPKTYFAQFNKSAYMKMRDDFNADKEDMMLLYLLLIYGFNRMLRFNGKGDFNLPVGNVDFNSNVVNALNSYFSYVKGKNICFYSLDFEDFINSVLPTEKDFIYLDPPYLITFSEYNKFWNEETELRLLNLLDSLNERGVRFAISNVLWHKNKYNAIFNEWAQKYEIVKIKSNYISYHDNSNKNSYEVLVKNY